MDWVVFLDAFGVLDGWEKIERKVVEKGWKFYIELHNVMNML